MSAWDRLLTPADRQAFAASVFGARRGFGHRPALLVVDTTYDFVGTPEVSLEESTRDYPYSCGPAGWRAVAAMRPLLAAARASGVPVVYTRGESSAGPHWRLQPGRAHSPPGLPPGAAFVAEVAPRDGDIVITKSRPSAFFGTTIVSTLIDLRVGSLLVCGGSTSGCVRATVVDAFSYNYDVSVVEDATFDRWETSHAMALFDLQSRYADVVTLREACEHLDSLPSG